MQNHPQLLNYAEKCCLWRSQCMINIIFIPHQTFSHLYRKTVQRPHSQIHFISFSAVSSSLYAECALHIQTPVCTSSLHSPWNPDDLILKLSYIYLTICILKILLIKFPSTPRSALPSTYWKVGSSITGYCSLGQETEPQLAPDEFIRVWMCAKHTDFGRGSWQVKDSLVVILSSN